MPRPSADDPIESLPQQLADALAGVLGPVEVHSLRRLTGGASRETWSFDAVAADGTAGDLVTGAESAEEILSSLGLA